MSHPFNSTHHAGFQQKDVDSNSSAAKLEYGHTKGSKNKMDKFFSPDLLKKVQEKLYPDDHKLWKLVKENGEKLSKGTELASQLSKNCHGAHVVMPLP